MNKDKPFIDELVKEIRKINKNNGWNVLVPKDWENTDTTILGCLMLVVSELGEAAEAFRNDDFANFVEEIADTIIRLFDIVGGLGGVSIQDEILNKMEKNKGRGYRHGGKRI